MQQAPLPHPVCGMQQPPDSHAGAAEAPFVIAPAPPLISRFTSPPQSGHALTSGSDIF
ncbi:MAG TPA: hypothetical protein VKB38_16905 [Terracidiphilus sp.]|nr:hypothetical protein [Terracidiphilus sp.]